MIQVRIDYTDARASMGYLGIGPFQKEAAAKGMRAALDYIREKTRQGEVLGCIEKGGDPIPELAKAAWPEEKDFVVALIPKIPPEISFSEGFDIRI